MDREVCWNVFVCRVCVGEKRTRSSCLKLYTKSTNWAFWPLSNDDDHGASCHTVTARVFALKAPVADQSGLADAVRAINNLATAQGEKDTPSPIDVKGLGRPKEFSGKEEDFQQWPKKTEAFFAGVIKNFEMMLEWSAEQATEITTTAIDLEFLPTVTNVERGVQNLECVLQQMHTALMAPTSYEARDTVANSRKNPLWRHGKDCRNVMIRRQVGGKRNLL